MARGLCGRGGDWVGGRGAAVSEVLGPLAEQPYKSLQGGTTDLIPDASWSRCSFLSWCFLLSLFFLFKRSMTKTTWEVFPVFDHFTTPTMPSQAEQREASRHRFLGREQNVKVASHV